MEQRNETKKERRLIFIILLITFILIIILFYLIQCFGLIENKSKIPTGNVDIFDIWFGNFCCNCQYHNKNNICTNCNSVINNNSVIGTGVHEILAYDDENTYSVDTPLNIFTHTSYWAMNDKIAPESENSYQFVIRNNNSFNIKYSIEMIEDNQYNINMRYRLKINGKYIFGSDEQYVTVQELQQKNISLAANTYDVYTLDWKWIESDNDTEIGTDINSNYKLNIKISAKQY